MTITQVDRYYRIQFQYKPYLVKLMHALPYKKWDPVNKLWLVPVEYKSDVLELRKHGFRFAGNIDTREEAIPQIIPLPELTVDIPLKMQLFPFQRNGTAYALDKKRLIIGDQPGLGKTAQSIAAIYAAKAFPCLVICPSSLKINWQREWEKWTDVKSIILSDSTKSTWMRFWEVMNVGVFITNFESLKKYFVQSIDIPEGKPMRLNHVSFKPSINLFKSVIIDESHRVKSAKAQQTKFSKGIARGKEYILCLTGTPVVNKPKDLIAQLGIIDRIDEFGGYNGFLNRYCGGDKEASNLKELNAKLCNTCFYRRDKSEVLKDLPAKMRQVVYCQIDPAHRHEYSVAETDLRKYLEQFKNMTPEQVDKSMRGEIMVRIQKLKNISARGKLKDVFEYIDDVIDSGEKLVLFGHLREVLKQVKEMYITKHISVTGEDDLQDRQTAIDRFQDNNVPLAICSIQAGGVGITLTAASRVAFIELGWHPAIHDQCEDRCHRIGQTDSVQCTYFLGKDTIDEWVYNMIEEKRAMANAVTGSQEQTEVDIVSRVLDLFNQPKREPDEETKRGMEIFSNQ